MRDKKIREIPHRLSPKSYIGRATVSFTACVKDRQHAFDKPNITNLFIGILDAERKKQNCLVLLYCFMPDHVHLILQGQTDCSDLYKTMVSFKRKTGFWFSKNMPCFRWQKNFYDRIIRSQQEFTTQLRYLADNPVRSSLVAQWQDYTFTGTLGCDYSSVFDAMIC